MSGTTLAAEAAAVPAGMSGRAAIVAIAVAAVALLLAHVAIRLRAAAGVIEDALALPLSTPDATPNATFVAIPTQRAAAPAWAHLLGDEVAV